jgi:8-oxo-dGTP pyrophosphatase MutT (NUDIX family)
MIQGRELILQAAALPLKAGRICLVTSRSGKRWVVPKGRLEPGNSLETTALAEAWEEAGLEGRLASGQIGTYYYKKSKKEFKVSVFLMHVADVAEEWPECSRRSRLWVRPARSLVHIRNQGLRKIIRQCAAVNQRSLCQFI